MANKFYALFGVCRSKGGTKKACYTKAVKALGGKPKKKRHRSRRCVFGVNKNTGNCLKHPRRRPAARKHKRKPCCKACA